MRPFISGHVANSMAAEVIALLHSLLMAPESNAAQIWTTTAEKVSVGLRPAEGAKMKQCYSRASKGHPRIVLPTSQTLLLS